MPPVERYLHSRSELQQARNGETDFSPLNDRRDERWSTVRPLDGKSHVLARRVLYVHVASAILAADEPSHWQRHALERVDRQRDGHALT